MKRLFFYLLLLTTVSLGAKEVKVLTIGNSFAASVFRYLPKIVETEPDCKLVLFSANHGGCSLERHWKYIEQEELFPDVRNYRSKKETMRALLMREQWDIVTIQQVSHLSWRAETYFPFAEDIYNYIKKYAPQAEVVVQQTWSYRLDDPRIMAGSKWNIGQTEMFKRLEKNYAYLAKKFKLRVIPMGLCVQNARAMEKKPFVNYDANLLMTLRYPDLPPQAGSFVGSMIWKKDKNGKLFIRRDTIHLNERGMYLQACIWFGFLFDKDPVEIKYVPQTVDNDDAKFLREVASKTLKEFKQPRD